MISFKGPHIFFALALNKENVETEISFKIKFKNTCEKSFPHTSCGKDIVTSFVAMKSQHCPEAKHKFHRNSYQACEEK